MKKLTQSVLIVILYSVSTGYGQGSEQARNSEESDSQLFVAYELGEMVFNNFQHFAGEAGLQFKNRHMLRFVYMNVKLSESHLSSDFANVVDGSNVEGLYKGYELFYDIPVYKNINGGGSLGYYNDYYVHTVSGESVNHHTATVGFEVNYREMDLFKVRGLYFNLSFPFRFYLNPLEETQLGDSTVNRHFFENNIWFFVGYQFR